MGAFNEESSEGRGRVLGSGLDVARMEIAKLELKEGDVLVLRGHFSSYDMQKLTEHFNSKCAVLFLSPNQDVRILSQAELDDIKRQLSRQGDQAPGPCGCPGPCPIPWPH